MSAITELETLIYVSDARLRFGLSLNCIFIDLSVHFLIKGDLNKGWWTAQSNEKFVQRSKCFADQYSNYTVLPNTPYQQNIDGRLTLGENIADNGGLRQALAGYRSWVAENGAEPKMPGVDVTAEQLFFLSYAQIWCTKLRDSAVSILMRNVHAIPEYRVTGVLQNMREFSDAFKCKTGSRMNPDKKCILW